MCAKYASSKFGLASYFRFNFIVRWWSAFYFLCHVCVTIFDSDAGDPKAIGENRSDSDFSQELFYVHFRI